MALSKKIVYLGAVADSVVPETALFKPKPKTLKPKSSYILAVKFEDPARVCHCWVFRLDWIHTNDDLSVEARD